jgi:hypothetical protein
MKKTIEQLLELKNNPYYHLSIDEQRELDAFLSNNSEQEMYPRINSRDSSNKTPAIVLNKNLVKKEIGLIPQLENDNTFNSEDTTTVDR